MGRVDELHLLAQRADQLSRLPANEREAHREEAIAVNNAILAVATPDRVARAKALLEARFGPMIRAQGSAATADPWWLLRQDDGRPPIILTIIVGALGRTRPTLTTGQILGQWRQLQQRRGSMNLDQLRREIKRLLDLLQPRVADREAFLRTAPNGWQNRMEILLVADPLIPNLIARSQTHG